MRAYATLLSSKNYLKGVLVLNSSLKKVNSRYPLITLISYKLYLNFKEIEGILDKHKIRYIILEERSKLPEGISKNIYSKRWINTFDKLQVFSLTSFNKIVFLDSDMLVIRNIDHLFEKKHLSFATASEQVSGYEDWNLPNSGMMVIEPRNGLSEQIFNIWPEVQSKKNDFGDQDLIHAYFADFFKKDQGWRVPATNNCFVFLIDKVLKERNYNFRLRRSDEFTISVLHFAIKERPWLMSRKHLLRFYLKKTMEGKFYEMKANYLYLKHLARLN